MKALYGESPSFETLLEVFRSLVQTVGEESVRVGSNEHAIQTWAAIADEVTAGTADSTFNRVLKTSPLWLAEA